MALWSLSLHHHQLHQQLKLLQKLEKTCQNLRERMAEKLKFGPHLCQKCYGHGETYNVRNDETDLNVLAQERVILACSLCQGSSWPKGVPKVPKSCAPCDKCKGFGGHYVSGGGMWQILRLCGCMPPSCFELNWDSYWRRRALQTGGLLELRDDGYWWRITLQGEERVCKNK